MTNPSHVTNASEIDTDMSGKLKTGASVVVCDTCRASIVACETKGDSIVEYMLGLNTVSGVL